MKHALGLTILAFLVLLASPRPAAAADLYVSNGPAGTIGEYNDSTGAAINASLVTGLADPVGIAVDGSGNLYVGVTTHRASARLGSTTPSPERRSTSP